MFLAIAIAIAMALLVIVVFEVVCLLVGLCDLCGLKLDFVRWMDGWMDRSMKRQTERDSPRFGFPAEHFGKQPKHDWPEQSLFLGFAGDLRIATSSFFLLSSRLMPPTTTMAMSYTDMERLNEIATQPATQPRNNATR